MGWVRNLVIKFETVRDASGRIDESGKVKIILTLPDYPTELGVDKRVH